MKLLWTIHARDDLLEIGRFIAGDNPAAARRWVDKLRERARKAAQHPRTGRVVPEIGRDDVREVLLRTYRIVYRVLGTEIHVLTVFESHRLLRAEDAAVPPRTKAP